ncbi:MAG: hypothetical protein MUO77_11345 [Anaerolineales bacterium]|nr:hypothetical protein [Anaerolineales bacterium]
MSENGTQEPIYQTFGMERVEYFARAMVASLTSMAWNFGWAFSPTVSDLLQLLWIWPTVYRNDHLVHDFRDHILGIFLET